MRWYNEVIVTVSWNIIRSYYTYVKRDGGNKKSIVYVREESCREFDNLENKIKNYELFLVESNELWKEVYDVYLKINEVVVRKNIV